MKKQFIAVLLACAVTNAAKSSEIAYADDDDVELLRLEQRAKEAAQRANLLAQQVVSNRAKQDAHAQTITSLANERVQAQQERAAVRAQHAAIKEQERTWLAQQIKQLKALKSRKEKELDEYSLTMQGKIASLEAERAAYGAEIRTVATSSDTVLQLALNAIEADLLIREFNEHLAQRGERKLVATRVSPELLGGLRAWKWYESVLKK